MKKQQIKIENIPIKDIKVNGYNPRKWNDKQKEALKKSITKFGIVDPLLLNSASSRKNILIGGAFRLEVLRKMGYTEVPVVYINIPNKKKEQELNLRLNKNTGSWDYELLKDFDVSFLEDVGFDDTDLSEIWDDGVLLEDDTFDTKKEIEKAQKTDIMEGDFFKLGDHYLLCGDSTDKEVVDMVVGKNKVNVILNDPPYNINLSYNKGTGGKQSYGGKVNDSLENSEYKSFLTETLKNGLSVSHDDAHIFYWSDQKYTGMVQDIFQEQELQFKRTCLWIKNGANPTPQIAFNKCYEPCHYAVKGKPFLSDTYTKFNEILNNDIDSGNATIDEINDMFDIWLERRISGDAYEHPTQKPLTLFEKPLRRCSKVGDKILILFGGSGSELLACEQLKRQAFVVEKSPIFIQLIINRYEQLTGNKAKKIN